MVEVAICFVEQWKKSMDFRFVPECKSCTGKSYIPSFSFSSTTFAGPRFVGIPARNIAQMVT